MFLLILTWLQLLARNAINHGILLTIQVLANVTSVLEMIPVFSVTVLMMLGIEEIEKVDNSNLLPPINFSMNSNHYFISTRLFRADNDRFRAKYYSLFVKPDSDTPDGLLMIAKISDSHINKSCEWYLNKRRSLLVFPIKFFHCNGNPCFRVNPSCSYRNIPIQGYQREQNLTVVEYVFRTSRVGVIDRTINSVNHDI